MKAVMLEIEPGILDGRRRTAPIAGTKCGMECRIRRRCRIVRTRTWNWIQERGYARKMPAILEPLECPATDVASVPRRFGAGVLMILVTAFAVLFAAMQTVRVGQKLFEIIAVLFLGVTLGQILLFQGKRPRAASLLVGSILFPLELLVVDYYVALGGIYVWGGRGMFYGRVAGTVLGYVAAGAALGYLAGCVMASVFLVQEKLRRRAHPPVQIELLPFTAADFDTLISWVRPVATPRPLVARPVSLPPGPRPVGGPSGRDRRRAAELPLFQGGVRRDAADGGLRGTGEHRPGDSCAPASTWPSSIQRATIGAI